MSAPRQDRPRPNFRYAWLAARMFWQEYKDRPDRALPLLLAMEERRPLTLMLRALKAKLLLSTGEPELAHDLFLDVREAARERDDPETRYIRHFAQAWLARIRWDPFNASEQDRAAAKVDCRRSLKSLLWLPAPDQPDPLDLEFDAWIEANPPMEDDLKKRSAAQSRQ